MEATDPEDPPDSVRPLWAREKSAPIWMDALPPTEWVSEAETSENPWMIWMLHDVASNFVLVSCGFLKISLERFLGLK